MGPEYVKRHKMNNPKAAEQARARDSMRRVAKGAGEFITISGALFDHDDLCYLCGTPIESAAEAHLDHIIPIALGGTHTWDNLAPTHARCNLIKRGLHPDKIPRHIQWKFLMERARRVDLPNAHLVPGLQEARAAWQRSRK